MKTKLIRGYIYMGLMAWAFSWAKKPNKKPNTSTVMTILLVSLDVLLSFYFIKYWHSVLLSWWEFLPWSLAGRCKEACIWIRPFSFLVCCHLWLFFFLYSKGCKHHNSFTWYFVIGIICECLDDYLQVLLKEQRMVDTCNWLVLFLFLFLVILQWVDFIYVL